MRSTVASVCCPRSPTSASEPSRLTTSARSLPTKPKPSRPASAPAAKTVNDALVTIVFTRVIDLTRVGWLGSE